MKQTAIYPGMFDPLTNGHMDLIIRTSKLFKKIIVAIAKDSPKKPLFTTKKRVALAQKVTQSLSNVEVHCFNGLLIDFAKQHNASILIRGLRAVSDFEYEFQMASMNRKLAPQIESLFLTPTEQYAFLSSTLVKQVASLKGNISEFVHPEIEKALKTHYS